MTSTPILCELYDYIEIACTFHYPVLLRLDNGEEFKGIATDTLLKPNKTEYLILTEEASKRTIQVALDKLTQMQALVKNPHFDKVDFHS